MVSSLLLGKNQLAVNQVKALKLSKENKHLQSEMKHKSLQ